jgi:alpha-beta hydrolase superfamily lysophospholipase
VNLLKWLVPPATSIGISVAVLASAIWLGGPESIPPLPSINEPFSKVDFSAVPPHQTSLARDGTALAWLHYPPTAQAATPTRRVVLVHGSSARGRSMHPMAQALAAAGYDVASLDMRGHGDSGPRGQASYIGQLEDDIEDFMRAQAWPGPTTLVGFSSGGGFVLRFAGSSQAQLFDRYLLLSPFLHQDAPTARPGNGGWVSVGLPRVIGLSVLNTLGITWWNHLPTLRFGLNDFARVHLTEQYSHTLATNFRPHANYAQDIQRIARPLRILAGSEDELFDGTQYAQIFEAAGHPVPVELVPSINHMGLTLDAPALGAVVKAIGLE